MPSSDAIGPNDVITVHDRYLYKNDGTRFFLKGIAFPVSVQDHYNATAWIGILQQLDDLGLQYNTVRIYRMDPTVDYSEFFQAAMKLGVYVIVPLTAESGKGVLSRNKPAPDCYTQHLYEYGIACIENYLQYPNVLAGLLANEVMNSKASWASAPCIKAYGRDLKLYASMHNHRPLPLLYAAQHSEINVHVGNVGTMLLTLNYLTCSDNHNNNNGDDTSNSELLSESSPEVDIFGVNIESWCSSRNSFVFADDGKSAGSYYSLWLGLHQSTVPLA